MQGLDGAATRQLPPRFGIYNVNPERRLHSSVFANRRVSIPYKKVSLSLRATSTYPHHVATSQETILTAVSCGKSRWQKFKLQLDTL